MVGFMGSKKSDNSNLSEKGDKVLNNSVNKRYALTWLQGNGLSLTQNKYNDLFMSKINNFLPKDIGDVQKIMFIEKNRHFVVSGGELEAASGAKHINKADLLKRLERLNQPITLFDENDNKNRSLRVVAYDRFYIEKENDYWTVKGSFSSTVFPYLFIEENRKYLSWKISLTCNLTSLQSYLLAIYLKDNCYRSSWTVSIEELKKIIESPYYEDFRYFNSKILKKCHKEITEKTSLKYEYKVIRKYRKAESIRFTVFPNESDLAEMKDAKAETPSLPKARKTKDLTVLATSDEMEIANFIEEVDHSLLDKLSYETIEKCYFIFCSYSKKYQDIHSDENIVFDFRYVLDSVNEQILKGAKINNLDSYVVASCEKFCKKL